jgi:hypothetical protein
MAEMEQFEESSPPVTKQFEAVKATSLDEQSPPQIDFACNDPRGAVNMRAVFQVPMPFDRLWNVVADPDEFTRVFSRTFKGYDNLVVHEDDGAGKNCSHDRVFLKLWLIGRLS